MKNKSGRRNSMKLKKAIAAFLAISLLLHSQAVELPLIPPQQKTQNRRLLPPQMQAARLRPTKSWTICTSRKTKFLQITKMYGTRSLAL